MIKLSKKQSLGMHHVMVSRSRVKLTSCINTNARNIVRILSNQYEGTWSASTPYSHKVKLLLISHA